MKHIIWAEKYRPTTVEQCILPKQLKERFQQFVTSQQIPTLLLSGRAGIGKTTVARAILEEIGADYIIVNGSLNGNIDTLRTEIQRFASSVSFSSTRKYVIIDEADYLTAAVQPALRGFIDEFAGNCGFIFTCNYRNRIIEPLQSRTAVIDFDFSSAEKKQLAVDFFKRLQMILTEENITFDKKVIAELISKFFPDWRRILNEAQSYANNSGGLIDSGIFAVLSDGTFSALVSALKAADFKKIRMWVAENSDIEPSELFRKIFDSVSDLMTDSGVAATILTLGKYQFQAAHAVDQEINTTACLLEILINAQWR